MTQPLRFSYPSPATDVPRPSQPPRRITWPPRSMERRLEAFYGKGAHRYGDYHGGYLNFGLWKNARNGYVRAAESLVHAVCAIAQVNGKSEVLDVACGMGTELLSIMTKFSPRRIVGLDVTWSHVEVAWTRIRSQAETGVAEVRHGTAVRLPWSNPAFSHVICVEGTQHFAPRERFFRESARILRPGGVLALTDIVLRRPPKTAFERLLLSAAMRYWHVPAENSDDEDSYRAKLEASGFKQVSIRMIGADVIPGWWNEQSRPENVRAVRRIRGAFAAYRSLLIDWVTHSLYRRGMIDYAIVLAQK